jgi:hypothetical protein
MIVTLMNFFVIFVPAWFYFGLYFAICHFLHTAGKLPIGSAGRHRVHIEIAMD